MLEMLEMIYFLLRLLQVGTITAAAIIVIGFVVLYARHEVRAAWKGDHS